MQRSLTIDFAPAYELLVSLAVYGERPRWKAMDVGQAWGTEVEKRLGAEGKALLKRIDPFQDMQPLLGLVAQAPGARTADGFLDWLATLTPGELYERSFCHMVEDAREHLPADLGAWRDRVVAALRFWHAHYFADVDPAIFAHLQADAEARRAQAAVTPMLELIAEATNGLYIDPPEHGQVLMVPQHHMRPWNLSCGSGNMRVILYPAEPPQANPDDPPLALSRLTRALSDENRLRILRFLAQAPLTLAELTERTGLAKSTVHHHMVMLRAAGLVIIHEKERDGRYSLRPGWLDLVAGRLSGFVLPQ